MPFIPLDLLESGAAELGVALSQDQLGRLDAFASYLVEMNRKLKNVRRIPSRR